MTISENGVTSSVVPLVGAALRSYPQSALDLIGNTPLVELSGLCENPRVHLYAKLEWYNPGGSVKDRPAKQMLLDALASETLRPGMRVLEATSGNTGTALAFVCAILGFPVTLVIPEVTSTRKRQDMERFGATLHVVPGETTEHALEIAYGMLASEPERYFLSDQYTNPSNPKAHYLGTGPEILRQCTEVTHVVAAQGSFGTLGGVGRYLKEVRPDTHICAVVAQPGTRTLFGMKEEGHTMPLVDDAVLSTRLLVSGYDAHDGIQAGLRFGFQLGPSAGGVLAAALRIARRLREGHLVCVFADGGNKYPESVLYRPDAKMRVSQAEADQDAFTRW